jgi:CRISPR-associated endonuclease/helicase Cas3
MFLFRAPSDPPRGLRLGRDTTAMLLSAHGSLDLFHPETYETYFRSYLANVQPDRAAVTVAREARDFPEVEARFRMIDDEGMVPVVVPYGDSARRVEAFRAESP